MRRFSARLSVAAAGAAGDAVERAIEEYDVVIVGGGPAGLSTAIRLKELAAKHTGSGDSLRVAVLEKGSAIGVHTMSGACIQTNALEELFPNWKTNGAPVKQKVSGDHFYYLSKTGHYECPILPTTLHNEHNYIISLGDLCRWLGEQAESLGVEIFCGFAGSNPVFSSDGGKKHLEGVQLNDVGINKKREKTDQFQPGMILKGRQTVLAEGCRGSLTKVLEKHFSLRGEHQYQSYGLGVKEVWEIPKEQFKAGRIRHTIGWPLTKQEGHANTYGGSWSYEFGDNMVSTGFVVGLDYTNPYTRPYMEFQKWKTHPFVSSLLQGGKPVSYGARTLIEGGLVGQCKMSFPGGVVVGDACGFLNLPKIKGTHTAMKSGILAAESLYSELFKDGKGDAKPDYGRECKEYYDRYRSSWLYQELYSVRNVRQMFAMNFYAGVLYTGVTCMFTHGMEPWTLKHTHADHATLLPAKDCKPIEYPKPDGKLTFDLLTNHARSGATHKADQPSHLKLKEWTDAEKINLNVYAGPEGRYCPAGVYEWVDAGGENNSGKKKLQINAQNCVHCKACDIKDPTQNINWTTPEGGGGPNYTSM